MSLTRQARPAMGLRPGRAPLFESRGRLRWLIEEAAVAIGAVTTTLGIAGIVMHAWNWSLHQPQRYNSDTLLTAMVVKDVVHHGWFFTNPSLAAPFGQELYDYPASTDNLHLLLVKGLGLVSSNVFVVMNLFFIATFVLVTLSAYFVLRCLRVSRMVSAGISVLYALLPYHFFRGEMHLFLSAYYAVPLTVLLVVWALDAQSRIWGLRRAASGGLRLQLDRRRSAIALVCCVILAMASGGGYYAIFAVVTLVACGLVVAVGRRGWMSLATTVVFAAIIILVLGLNLIPTLAYHLAHGADPLIGRRFPLESELYGLKIARLFLPVTGHRIGALADLSARYGAFPIAGEASEALGAIFGVGLILVLARGLAGRFGTMASDWRGRTLNSLALAAVVAMLFGAMTGPSGIVALVVTAQFRSWSRISVLIAFCGAAGLGLLLDQLLARLPVVRGSRMVIPGLVVIALLVVGTLDQTTTQDVPNFRYISDRITVNTDFMRAVQSDLPQDAMVFQLPYMAFPENGPINGMQDYQPVQGYLLSDGLRWSYGAIRGRPQDWQPALLRYPGYPMSVVMRAVAVAGFDAVYVDRTGYSDGGAGVDSSLRSIAGPPILTSSDGSLELYDIRPLMAGLRQQFPKQQLASMADAALHQVGVQYGSGFYGEESKGPDVWRWTASRADLVLSNPDSHPRTVSVRARLATPGSASTVRVTGPSTNVLVSTSSVDTMLSIDLSIPPGQSDIRLSTNAPRQPGDPRDLRLRVLDPQFLDPGLAPLQG